MAAPALIDDLARLAPAEVQRYLDGLNEANPDAVASLLAELYDFDKVFARPEQIEPEGDWRIWMVNAGRGFGKTRVGAEWVRKQKAAGFKRLALVGRTASDVRDVMIEGESGILACSPPWDRPRYYPSKRLLLWTNERGEVTCEAHCYSGEKPDQLRGPQHDAAWCDELAAWKYKEAWDNLMLGLRLGTNPRCCVTTTPKPTLLIKQLMERKSTVVTGGSTYDNIANLADAFVDEIIQQYEGTDLGEQELYARLLEQAAGALWRRAWIEKNRVTQQDDEGEWLHPDLDSLVVAVDPAVTSEEESDETGIVSVGRAFIDGEPHFYVLDDRTCRASPNDWCTAALDAYDEFEADGILAETNNGGDLVETVLRTIDQDVPYQKVHASRGKLPRAQPIAALYQQGRVHHCGVFRDLEDELCQWEPGKRGAAAVSPNRLDALVWGVSKLNPKRRRKRGKLDTSGLDQKSQWEG